MTYRRQTSAVLSRSLFLSFDIAPDNDSLKLSVTDSGRFHRLVLVATDSLTGFPAIRIVPNPFRAKTRLATFFIAMSSHLGMVRMKIEEVGVDLVVELRG